MTASPAGLEDPDGHADLTPYTQDLHMLLLFGARERTQHEFRTLLAASGFELQDVTMRITAGASWARSGRTASTTRRRLSGLTARRHVARMRAASASLQSWSTRQTR
jgi:hypothetical protein